MSTPVSGDRIITMSAVGSGVSTLAIDHPMDDTFVERPVESAVHRDTSVDRTITILGNGTTAFEVTSGALTAADRGAKLIFVGGWSPTVTFISSVTDSTHGVATAAIPAQSGDVVLNDLNYLYLASDEPSTKVYFGADAYGNRSVFDLSLSNARKKVLYSPMLAADPNEYTYGPAVFTQGSDWFTFPAGHLPLAAPGMLVFARTGATWIVEGAVILERTPTAIRMDSPARITHTVISYPPVYVYPTVARTVRLPYGQAVIDWIHAYAEGGTHTGLRAYVIGGWGGGESNGEIGKVGLSAGSTVQLHQNYLGGLTLRSSSSWPRWIQCLTPGSAMAIRASAVGGTPTLMRLSVGFHVENG